MILARNASWRTRQKVSGTFRTTDGATAFATVRGYLSTAKKQEQPLLAALPSVLAGHALDAHNPLSPDATHVERLRGWPCHPLVHAAPLAPLGIP